MKVNIIKCLIGVLVIIYSISHQIFLSIYYLLSIGILEIETEKEQDELSCHRKRWLCLLPIFFSNSVHFSTVSVYYVFGN